MIDTRPAVAGSAAKLTDREDPLNVLRSTAAVVRQAEDVSIDMDAISATAGRIARSGAAPPAWNTHYHFTGDERSVASFVLVLDTLNYCFWTEPRWVFDYEGEILDGYWALASSLKTAILAGRPILDAGYLSRITPDELAELLGGQGRLALMEQRAAGLRELGRLALDRHDGDLAAIVESAGGDAIRLVEIARDCLPSYRDCVEYGGATVWLLKRAQILAADLYGALAGEGLGDLARIDSLTTFADYKIPQILRHFGVMRYSKRSGPEGRWPATAAGRQLDQEVEIRSATIWAVELLRAELLKLGIDRSAVQLDWLLWEAEPDYQSTRSAISSYIDYLLLSYTSDKPGYGFEIVAAAPDSAARVGRLTTPHGVVDTPAFIPVGTAGSVKSLTPDEVRELGAQITLANTYHLWLRPGQEVVRTLGGLHRFTGWDGTLFDRQRRISGIQPRLRLGTRSRQDRQHVPWSGRRDRSRGRARRSASSMMMACGSTRTSTAAGCASIRRLRSRYSRRWARTLSWPSTSARRPFHPMTTRRRPWTGLIVGPRHASGPTRAAANGYSA